MLEFLDALRTTSLSLTLAHKVDESCNHEHGMQVELEFGVGPPGEGLALLGVVGDDPVEDEGHDAVEEDLSQEDEESEAAARSCSKAVLVMLAMSAKKEKKKITHNSMAFAFDEQCIAYEIIR